MWSKRNLRYNVSKKHSSVGKINTAQVMQQVKKVGSRDWTF